MASAPASHPLAIPLSMSPAPFLYTKLNPLVSSRLFLHMPRAVPALTDDASAVQNADSMQFTVGFEPKQL